MRFMVEEDYDDALKKYIKKRWIEDLIRKDLNDGIIYHSKWMQVK